MTRLKLALVILLMLMVDTTLLSELRFAGVRSDAMVLIPIGAGLVAGSERAAVVGFVTGLVTDLFLQTPLGLTALTYSLVGFGVGMLQAGLIRSAWWITPLTALVASALAMVLFAVIGATVGLGHLVRPDLAVTAVSVALGNVVLSIPVVRLVSWALASPEADRALVVR